MTRAFGKVLISAVGIAVVVGAAGCGGSDAPGESSAGESPSSSPVDVDVAFAQIAKAVKPFWCSDAYDGMADTNDAGNMADMNARVYEYHGVVTTWDDNLGRIAVPPAAQPIVDKAREFNAAETADLAALAEVVKKSKVDEMDKEKDQKERNRLLGLVYYDDALVAVEADRLNAALGHPEPRGRIASDQLEVANQTFYRDIFPVHDRFEGALSRNDLNGAKAANAVEEDAAQRYIDQLGTIDWPGQVEDQVNALRDSLRKLIESDRRQVDVATAAQIVPVPEDGGPAGRAFNDANDALWAGVDALPSELRPSKC